MSEVLYCSRTGRWWAYPGDLSVYLSPEQIPRILIFGLLLCIIFLSLADKNVGIVPNIVLSEELNFWMFRLLQCNKYQVLYTGIKGNLIILRRNYINGHRIRGLDFLTV